MSQLFALALREPWGPAVRERYYRSLFKVVKPDDLDAHIAAVLTSLGRPGAWAGFRATAGTGMAAAGAALPCVSAPITVGPAVVRFLETVEVHA